MAIIPYDDFQGRLAREASNGDVVPYELGEDGVYRPIVGTPVGRPQGRPVPQRNPGLGAVGAAIDAVCLARAVAPQGFLRNLVSASPFDIVPGVRNARERAFNYLCGETPNAGVPTEVPFIGGQCDAVRYNVQVQGQRFTFSSFTCNQQGFQTAISQVWGPIGGFRLRQQSPSSYAVEVYCRGPGNQPIRPGGEWFGIAAQSSSASCDPPWITGQTASRVDGLPDNCGNPVPQQPVSPEPVYIPPQVEIPLGGGNTILTPINVSFNPELGINIEVGEINIGFDGENINIEEPTDPGGGGEIPRFPVDTGDCDPLPDPGDTTTDPSNPPPEPPPDRPDLEEPENPPEQPIRGVMVNVTQTGNTATEIAGIAPDPPNFFGDLGLVTFRIRVDGGASAFTNPQRVQKERCFVPCPWLGGAIAVTGTPRPGVVWTLTPVYDVGNLPTP